MKIQQLIYLVLYHIYKKSQEPDVIFRLPNGWQEEKLCENKVIRVVLLWIFTHAQ